MKRRILSLLLILAVSDMTVSANVPSEGSMKWASDKYSMFIHFGLYSYYGGVWDGEAVTRGYSEQIQSHAGIYSDWYARAAEVFDPSDFDADAIAALAKQAGMRSVVFTSKHHDGFCMFDSATTDYSSVRMMPSARDFVGELSRACEKEGLSFGLYFSLIDWNFPYAYPISSHNADPVTPEHHALNKAQVGELLTKYGKISELWFDMGSLTPSQSRELYGLVKSLQPECMVSGRLGNDMYDFAVMPDNTYPDGALQAPWQTAASMFDETWSWRSWQERGRPEDKTAEKLRSLINVVSHGGNYLLNIGPDRSGAVVPFEREVLMGIGKWLEENADAIYGTRPSPFREDFSWGAVTRKGRKLYLFLSGTAPEDEKICLDMSGYRLLACHNTEVKCRSRKGGFDINVPKSLYEDPCDVKVICLELDRDVVEFNSAETLPSASFMTTSRAQANYSYSCFDYYSNYRSTVSYEWLAKAPSARHVDIYHTEQEVGRNVSMEVDGNDYCISLGTDEHTLPMASCTWGPTYCSPLRGGTFNGPAEWKYIEEEGMSLLPDGTLDEEVRTFSNHLLVRNVSVEAAGFVLLELSSGNGVELAVDGRSFMKHLNPYRTEKRVEKLLLYLEEGEHQLILRSYNRFEDTLFSYLNPIEGRLFCTRVRLDAPLGGRACRLKLSAKDAPSPHSDCELHNVVVRIK